MAAPEPELDDPASLRRNLPRELFAKRPVSFASRFWFAWIVIGVCYWIIAASPGWIPSVLAIVVLGLIYAHLVELQHECVHEHGFRSRILNRFYGEACGLFMLSSYTHYKFEHLRHHASLGEPSNREFFNYRYERLDSRWKFARAAFHLGRYLVVGREMARSVLSRPLPNVPSANQRRIQNEYRAYLLVLVGVVAFSVVTGRPFFVVAWLVPLLFVSEPAHFVIELPEHFGLNTQSDTNVLTNTRTVNASWLAKWFTNGNNLHTAHHFSPGIPMANVPRLNDLVASQFAVVEPSYRSFFGKVMRGEITYQGAAEPRAATS